MVRYWWLIAILSSSVIELSAGDLRYFPQVANGAEGDLSFSTSVQLINTGAPAEVHLDCLDEEGQPVDMSWNSGGVNSDSPFLLGRGEVARPGAREGNTSPIRRPCRQARVKSDPRLHLFRYDPGARWILLR